MRIKKLFTILIDLATISIGITLVFAASVLAEKPEMVVPALIVGIMGGIITIHGAIG